MRSFYAILLAALLLPRLGAAQGNSDPTPSPSDELAWAPGKILSAPVRAVEATFHGLGRLIKHKPKKTSTGQGKPTSQPAETGTAEPSSSQAKPTGQAEPTSEVVQTSPTAPSPGQAKPAGQAKPSSEAEQTGPTAFVQFQGSSSALGLVLTVVPDVGWQFTRHFAGDIGVPIFFVRRPFSSVPTQDWVWTTLLGSPYVDVRYTAARKGTSITSILTGTIPLSNSRKTFTTGRGGVDWFNHVEHRFKGLTPFLNLGAASGTVDRYVMPRPYSIARPYYTLGFISDFEGGFSYEFLRGFRIGGSYYTLVPAGPQKVYSRFVAPLSSIVGSGNHNRDFYSAFETIGSYGITRDNGYSAWIEVKRGRNVNIQIGYTHSVHYALDSINLMVNFNGTSLIRTLTAWNRD